MCLRNHYEGSPIECVISLEENRNGSHREIQETFRLHFQNFFVRLPDLPVEEFSDYLADFLQLHVAKAASCMRIVTDCEVRDALKQLATTS